jgi:hypothetical protein
MTGMAQTIGWNFTDATANPSATTSNITSSALSGGNNLGNVTLVTNSSVSSGYTGASGTYNAGAAARIGSLNTDASGSAYFEFTLSPAQSYQYTITAISFGTRSTSTGAQAYTIRSSADNYGTDLATGTITNNSSWTLKTHTGLNITRLAATTYRIYGYNGTGSPASGTANWRIDDLTISVSASIPNNVAILSSLVVNAGSNTVALNPAFQGANTSYNATVDNQVSSVTITPATAFPGSTITVNGNSVASGSNSAPVSLAVGNNTITVVVTSANGQVTQTYTVVITRSTPSLPSLTGSNLNTSFGTKCIQTSTIGSFQLSGANLDGSDIVLTAPQGYSLSLNNNSGFNNTLTLNYTGNSLAATTVYVLFAPAAVQSYAGNIVVNGSNTTTNIAVQGIGENRVAAVTTQTAGSLNSSGALLKANITDAGCAAVTAYGFEYSTTSGFTNGTGTVVTANNLNNNNFSYPISGLQPNTLYYVKAFVSTGAGTGYGAQQSFMTTGVPVVIAQQDALAYTQNFDNITSWTNGFTSANGANNFGPVLDNATGTIPNGIKVTHATDDFSTGTAGGVQRGTTTGSLILLATGGTDNTNATAVDLFLDFTGVNAGTISFDWASVNNSTGNRTGSLRVYGSVDGVQFTELTGAAVLNLVNGVLSSGSVSHIALPASFSNNPNARLRFYYYNGTGGSTGSRPKISIDNLVVRGYTPGDVTPPVVNTLSPATGSSAITPPSQVQVVFSEVVIPNNGNITVRNLTNGTSVVFPINHPSVSLSGQTLTLQTVFQAYKSYEITIDNGALNDLGGNVFAGIGSGNWTFTTGAPPTSFDFNDCINNLPGGFTQYSVSGAQVWACTTFGQTGNGVQINGFSGSAQDNEDWLISPSFDLSGYDYPVLRFSSRVRFAGPALKLMVSTDYTGLGNPHAATWTEVDGRFAEADSDVWTLTDQLDVAAFKAANVHFAFVYTSSPALGAARWTLDDFKISNSAIPAQPGVNIRGNSLNFDYIINGQSSVAKTFLLQGYNLAGNDVQIQAPAGFEISLDQNQYSSSIQIPAAVAGNKTTVYVRFRPLAADQNYAGSITATVLNTDVQVQGIALSGTSLRTLKVVNWNLEWFGSTASGLGPNDKNLQQQNVQQVLSALNADVYALVEIVDTLRFKNVVDALPGNYGYVVNDYGSYADNVNDPDYAGAQKIGFIYNKDIVKNLGTRGLLRTSTGNAFNSWASGRYPFLMQAEVTLNGATSQVDFIAIHAKANTGTAADKIEGYQRRAAAAQELKDTLDTYFADRKFVILGDFNDDFDRTITTEMAPVTISSYSSMLNDPNNYKPLTLPLSLSGNRSTVTFTDMIDHAIASNELAVAYLPNSASVFTDVLSLINNYGNTTSDHFPIVTRYDWRYFSKPVITISNINLPTDPGACGSNYTLSAPAVSGFNAIATISSNAPGNFPVGATTVTWTATDIFGNSSTQDQVITVTDLEKPRIKAPGTISVAAATDACGISISNLGTPVTSDNCGIASISNNAPAFFPVGTTVVTWTVTDIHGNVTDTAKQTVRVIDNTVPVVITKPITIQLVNGTASISVADINNGSSDACGISSYVLSKSNFGCSDIGNNTVTLTVTDIHGNSNTGTATVTVVGSIPVASIQVTPAEATYTGGNPRIIYLGYGAQSVSLQATATGASGYTYSWIGNGSLSQTNGSTVVFAPTSAGTYQFTVLVNSNSGCTATASVSIQVVDVRVPGSGGKKVYVCHDGSTLAISTNAVDAHLRNHATDKLGSCGQTNGNAAMISQLQLNAEAKDALSVQVLPNPSRSHFTLKLQSTVNAPVQLRITDASGRAVESRQHLSANSTVQVGHQLISGTYYAEFTQGSNRKVVQLIKIK